MRGLDLRIHADRGDWEHCSKRVHAPAQHGLPRQARNLLLGSVAMSVERLARFTMTFIVLLTKLADTINGAMRISPRVLEARR